MELGLAELRVVEEVAPELTVEGGEVCDTLKEGEGEGEV